MNWDMKIRFREHLYALMKEVKENKENSKLMTSQHVFYFNFLREVEVFIEMYDIHLGIRSINLGQEVGQP